MRCYFMKGGHIAGVELLDATKRFLRNESPNSRALKFGTARAKSRTVNEAKKG
jgi:hypothetical protein